MRCRKIKQCASIDRALPHHIHHPCLEKPVVPPRGMGLERIKMAICKIRYRVIQNYNCDFYSWGPTTRRKWNQIVNEMEKSKGNNDGFETPQENSMGHSESEFHSPTPMGDAAKTRAANIADTIASVAGGTAATLKEFASPIKKRPRKDIPDGKVTVRGRPRKNTQPQEKKPRISQEAREGMDIMHQLTSEACNKAAEVFMDSSFVLTDVKTSITAPSPVAPFVEAKSERRETSEYPNLDRFLSEF